MDRYFIRAAVCFCLNLGLGLCAQTLPPQEETNAPPSDRQSTAEVGEGPTAPVLPAPLGGFNPRLTQAETAEQQPNLLTGSIGVNALYIDNAFSSGSSTVADYQYSVLPSVGFQTFGRQTQWTMNYAGGVTINQRAVGNSQQTHDGALDFRHEFTRHLSTEVRQDYTMTNNPFVQIGANDLLSTVTGPGQLSPFAVPQPVTRISSISTANLMYQLARHSAMGVSGSFSLQNFRNAEALAGTGGALVDTTNGSGRAFYLSQISRHHAIGTEYQLQDLSFDGGVAHTMDQVVYLFDGMSFQRNMTLSIYAGPEFTHTHNVILARPGAAPAVLPVVGNVWSLGGGFAFAWRGKRNGLRVAADRSVSDGSGWGGAVRLNTASLELMRAFNSRWSVNCTLAYSDGRTIGVPSNLDAGKITTEQGLLGLSYRWTHNLSLTTQYGRIKQPHAGLFTSTLNPDHNEILAGVSYSFEKGFPK